MPESSEQTSQQRHAAWVGLRTLRQRPKLVDRTERGDPVYEVRSVRLVLRPEAAHFNRLVRCAKCDREVPGSAVLDASSLDRPSNSVICRACVRAAGASSSWQPESPPADVPTLDPAGPDGDEIEDELLAAAPAVVDGGRLADIENQLHAALTQLGDLAAVQRSQAIARRAADDAVQAQFSEAMADLDGLRAELAAAREGEASRAATLEEQVRRSVAAMAEALQGQRSDTATIASVVAEGQAEARRVQGELDQRVAALAAQVEDQRAAGAQASRAGGGGGADDDGSLPDSLAQAHFEVATLEERLQASVVALTQMVETQRSDLEAALDDRVPPDVGPLVRSIEELAEAGARIERRVDELAQQSRDTTARVDALLIAADTGASRVHVLEQRLQEAVQRLGGMVEAQRGDLQALVASTQARAAPSPTPMSPRKPGPGPGDLLDALERQLQAAEGRLAQLSVSGSNAD